MFTHLWYIPKYEIETSLSYLNVKVMTSYKMQGIIVVMLYFYRIQYRVLK